MSNVPENAPNHCPGTGSDDAGKASACAGCPNQNICASGVTSAPDPAIEIIKNRLANVKHKILVMSGKGGVGKSTVTALLGHALAKQNPDINVGILDADVCGPSQPRVLGARGEQVHRSGSGWSPVYITDNLSLMSIGFLLGSPDDAVIWRGPKKNGMIKQFLSEVDWGDLDYLLIDTPPGTSDEHLSLVQYVGEGARALLVSTPQELALLDVRKELAFCQKVALPVLGVVENMALFVCPNCEVGILDADVCGPSQPRVLGARGEQVHRSGSGWSPVYITDNLSLMSIGFLLGSPDDAVIWRGPKKNGMIKQFLSEVDWGDLDYLLIDTPPGTSDEHLSLVQYVGEGARALLVSTPQELALLDVRKELAFCQKVALPVLGVVENMALFVCPNCESRSEIFPATTGGCAAMCSSLGVDLLGALPLEPPLARAADAGRDYATLRPAAPALLALTDIVHKIREACEK